MRNLALILRLKILTLVLLAFVFTSCGDKQKTEQEYLDAAKASYDAQKFEETIATYKEFVKVYPNSEKAIYAYNQIAGIYFEKLKNYQEAINTYRELAEKYPNTKDAKQSLFMVAFIYDETLKDTEKAKDAYKKFLEKYPTDSDPNDKMSESAKAMLEVLESGKSVEDIIKSNIENQNSSGKKDTTKTKADTSNVKIKKLDENPDVDMKMKEKKAPEEKIKK